MVPLRVLCKLYAYTHATTIITSAAFFVLQGTPVEMYGKSWFAGTEVLSATYGWMPKSSNDTKIVFIALSINTKNAANSM